MNGTGTREIATFAGGCFWCLESDFHNAPGVLQVISGYTGGAKDDPTYEEVSSGRTGYYEAVQIIFDPSRVGFERLLEIFWRHIDPTDPGGQFADRGSQYRTAIFYHDERQRRNAEESKNKLAVSGKFHKPIVTAILPFAKFYPAEEYHQEFHRKNPVHYKKYSEGSGRNRFLSDTWGDEKMKTDEKYKKPDAETLKKKLTPFQFEVTQRDRTEPPFRNEFWDNEREGLYVDVVSGEPLFSSRDKFDSGTGWPSFTKPVEPANIETKDDRSHGMRRTEVRSKHGESHLGHVFPDGPEPTGLRYCVNSASLRFIPQEDLEKEGYGEYRKLFE